MKVITALAACTTSASTKEEAGQLIQRFQRNKLPAWGFVNRARPTSEQAGRGTPFEVVTSPQPVQRSCQHFANL